jgi:hypothetical protein
MAGEIYARIQKGEKITDEISFQIVREGQN